MNCSTCGKEIPDNPCTDPNAPGLMGYIARENIKPAQGWCSRKCHDIYEERTLN